MRVVKNGALLATPLFDQTDRVNDYWHHGLLSNTANPNFTVNGFICLLYTYQPVGTAGHTIMVIIPFLNETVGIRPIPLLRRAPGK